VNRAYVLICPAICVATAFVLEGCVSPRVGEEFPRSLQELWAHLDAAIPQNLREEMEQRPNAREWYMVIERYVDPVWLLADDSMVRDWPWAVKTPGGRENLHGVVVESYMRHVVEPELDAVAWLASEEARSSDRPTTSRLK